MTLRHFEILKAVAETGNFTRAAKQLYITQSAVSHSIKELEYEVGTPLFERTPKGVEITKSGLTLLEKAQPVLNAFLELKRQAESLEKQMPLQIVSSITIATFWLPKVLRQFEKRWPQVPIEIEVVSARAALERLKEGNADTALIEGSRPRGPFSCMEFASYEMAAVCAPEYIRRRQTGGEEKKAVMSPQEFCREKLLLREKGSAVRDALDSALYLSGYEASPVWSSVNSGALLAAAREGLGIAVLPELLIREEIDSGELTEVEISGITLKNQMLAVWQEEQRISEPVGDFLRLLKLGRAL